MKKLFILVCFIALSLPSFSQQTYTINNETLELKTEVDGTLDLLWNIIDSQYRYFVKDSDGNIQELTNTKGDDKKYQEEYKVVLSTLTQNSTLILDDVNLTLFSLKEFLNEYNASADPNYTFEGKAKLESRLGVFGGITNNSIVDNIGNTTTPFFGIEFEIFEQQKLARHALVFNLRYNLETDDIDKYSVTQFALGYRFRFINKEKFSMYANLKLVTYSFNNSTIINHDDPNNIITYKDSGSGIETPFILGLGADYKITKKSFITFSYHNIYALFIDNSGEFPVDFAIGFKTSL